jgi:hypothetical protein
MKIQMLSRSVLAAALLLLVQSSTPAQADSQHVAEQVQAHLQAGEFQSALELAEGVASEQERAALLSQIAEQQLTVGELSATQGTLRRMPRDQQRRELAGRRASRSALNGSGADFESLIELIMAQTSGPWLEEDGVGGTINEYETGVRVDPTGLLSRLTRTEENTRLQELGLQARKAELNADMAEASALRMVSLTRLEQAVAERIAQGQPVVESMRNLAGLYRIQHVFVYPETGEIVIAGPASGWEYSAQGMPASTHGGEPTLQLDDLVTVLRTFSDGGEGIFGCSINPRQAGLRDLKQYVEQSQSRGPISSRAVRSWVNQLQRKLGLQDVEIYGVPANSRVARVIVEADFRMKLIGIGKLDGGAEIPNYFDLMTSQQVKDVSSLDALRWWLSLKCEQVLKSENGQAFEIQNSAVLCQSENQFVNADGERIQTGQAEETNRQFAANFTEHFDTLALRDPVFADLRNVFDLALVAALIQRERLADQAGWDYGVFANNGPFQPAFHETPLVVDTVVNHRVYNNSNIVVQVAGGVRVDARSLVAEPQLSPRLGQVAQNSQSGELPAGRWWWDLKK